MRSFRADCAAAVRVRSSDRSSAVARASAACEARPSPRAPCAAPAPAHQPRSSAPVRLRPADRGRPSRLSPCSTSSAAPHARLTIDRQAARHRLQRGVGKGIVAAWAGRSNRPAAYQGRTSVPGRPRKCTRSARPASRACPAKRAACRSRPTTTSRKRPSRTRASAPIAASRPLRRSPSRRTGTAIALSAMPSSARARVAQRRAPARMEVLEVDAVVDHVQLLRRDAEAAPISSFTMFELQITARRRGLRNRRCSAAQRSSGRD